MREEHRQKIIEGKKKQWEQWYAEMPYPTEGKQKCAKCGEQKYFNAEDTALSEFYMRRCGRNAQGPYKLPDSYCRECDRKRNKAKREQHMRENPELEKQKHKERNKRYKEKLGKEEVRRRSRESGRRARRRQGVPELGPRIKDTYESSRILVPIGPVREWIIERWPTGGYYQDAKGKITNPEKVGKIVLEKYQEVELDWVDELLVTFGGPHLSTLYPDVYSSR